MQGRHHYEPGWWLENGDNHPSCIDLFCGAGGASLGYHNAGYDVWCGIDLADAALETYQWNLGNAIKADINHLPLRPGLFPDVVHGSPPCQGSSPAANASKNMARKKRLNGLTVSFAKAISYLAPKIFTMENVRQILKTSAFRDAQYIWKFECYPPYVYGDPKEYVVDFADYGVPQHRIRLFLMGQQAKEVKMMSYDPVGIDGRDERYGKMVDAMLNPQKTMTRWLTQED